MLHQLAQDKFILYLLIMAVLGTILGFLVVYLILFIKTIFEFLEWFSIAMAMGG